MFRDALEKVVHFIGYQVEMKLSIYFLFPFHFSFLSLVIVFSLLCPYLFFPFFISFCVLFLFSLLLCTYSYLILKAIFMPGQFFAVPDAN